MSEYAVRVTKKVVERKNKGKSYVAFSVAIPKKLAEELNIKGKEILHVKIIEIEIEPGKKTKALIYYKP